jgi:hypothetical protein
MSANLEKIKQLLGAGLSAEVVASTTGNSASFISQLMSEEKFHSEVIELRTQALASHTVRDRALDSIEDKLIKNLAEAVEDKLIYKPSDILNAFRVINSAKRRGVSVSDSTVINNTVVNLNLSKRVSLSFRTDAKNEVIEAGSRSMITMPAAKLLDNLTASKDPAQASKYDSVRRFLPSTLEHSKSSEGNSEDAKDRIERIRNAARNRNQSNCG